MGLPPPQPELLPLAPSPWSPVAPEKHGQYWHWSGKHSEPPRPLAIWLFSEGLFVHDPPYAVWLEKRPSEYGGFWANYSDSAPPTGSPDRFSETLATCCEKLEQQCRVLRCGRFEETAAVIEGIVATLKAAYAAKGGK